MVAGGNLVATESTGDIVFGGLGTITSVCDGRVVGFGHPMEFAGNSTYGMAGADALYIQGDSLGSPFKVANIGDLLGTIDQDRMTGISGPLGPLPDSAPVTSTVTYHPDGAVVADPDGLLRRAAAGRHGRCHVLRAGGQPPDRDRRLPGRVREQLLDGPRSHRQRSVHAQGRQPLHRHLRHRLRGQLRPARPGLPADQRRRRHRRLGPGRLRRRRRHLRAQDRRRGAAAWRRLARDRDGQPGAGQGRYGGHAPAAVRRRRARPVVPAGGARPCGRDDRDACSPRRSTPSRSSVASRARWPGSSDSPGTPTATTRRGSTSSPPAVGPSRSMPRCSPSRGRRSSPVTRS